MDKVMDFLIQNASLLLTIISFFSMLYYKIIDLEKRVIKLEAREEKYFELHQKKSEEILDKFHNFELKLQAIELAIKEQKSKN